jgi:hypothetical protein
MNCELSYRSVLEIDALHRASVSRSIIPLSSIPFLVLVISSYIFCSSACDYWVLPSSI